MRIKLHKFLHENKTIELKLLTFSTSDQKIFKKTFNLWKQLNGIIKNNLKGTRILNLPDALSESIVCKECPSPKISEEIFPNTDNAPYWTGDQSIYNSKYYVSVNFHTGFSFNRFSPIKELAVRLVRDR